LALEQLEIQTLTVGSVNVAVIQLAEGLAHETEFIDNFLALDHDVSFLNSLFDP
jgi:hypothetical protein